MQLNSGAAKLNSSVDRPHGKVKYPLIASLGALATAAAWLGFGQWHTGEPDNGTPLPQPSPLTNLFVARIPQVSERFAECDALAERQIQRYKKLQDFLLNYFTVIDNAAISQIPQERIIKSARNSFSEVTNILTQSQLKLRQLFPELPKYERCVFISDPFYGEYPGRPALIPSFERFPKLPTLGQQLATRVLYGEYAHLPDNFTGINWHVNTNNLPNSWNTNALLARVADVLIADQINALSAISELLAKDLENYSLLSSSGKLALRQRITAPLIILKQIKEFFPRLSQADTNYAR